MKKKYRILFAILRPFAALLYPRRFYGLESVPEGPAVICANHSSFIDPILVALVLGKNHFVHFMAKAELFGKPVLGSVLRFIGAVSVERDNGINSIRAAMKYIRDGDKIMIFPEGTRVSGDDSIAAKNGAVRIANKMAVPVVPLFIPRKKRLFKRIRISIGEPYIPQTEKNQNGVIDYNRMSDELMEKIYDLGRKGT